MDYSIIIQAVSVIQFLIVGIFLLTIRGVHKFSNIFFAFFLLSKAFCFVGDILAQYSFFYTNIPFIFVLTLCVDLLLGPSLYLYVKSLMYKDFRFKKYHLLHALPFIIGLIYFSFIFIAHPGEGLKYFWSPTWVNFVIHTSIYFHFIIYSSLCLYQLKIYEKELKTQYSSIEEKKMSWLFFLVLGFVLIWLTAYVNFILLAIGKQIIIPWEIIIIIVFVFANTIVYKGLKQPELFSGFTEKNNNPKYAKTALPDTKKDEYLETILSYMQNCKPYLNPTLALDEFAEKVSIPAHCISQVLNTNLNQNFYDFINSYRIEESKQQLKNDTCTVLEVLYEAGFNSKASFNRAFKKYTGMTPSEYRKTCSVS